MIVRIASDDVKITIWSSDQDMLQLQQKFKNVKVWDPRTRDYMITPAYDLVTYKALVGDRSDNIKGVKGIGDKTAEKILISQLEFIKHIASKPDKLIEYRKNRRVVDLIENELAIPSNLDYILSQRINFNYNRFLSFLKKNNFQNFMKNELDLVDFLEDIQNKNNENEREWFFNKGGEKCQA
jgi:DNA polymerase-1